MTNEEKNTIIEMKKAGNGYKSISRTLSIPLGTVKTVCRRENQEKSRIVLCKQCGKKIVELPKNNKEKIFCSNTCRNHWWNTNLDKVNRKAFYHKTCAYCGRPFTVYGRADAKYCSRACYRLGKGKYDE